MKYALMLGLAGLLPACGADTHSCTAKGCVGGPVDIQLVDDAGAPVSARGEYKTNRNSETRSFDCSVTPESSNLDADCTDGQVTVFPFIADPGTTLQFRFALADGSLTDWQGIRLDYESETDPDFNGPGCSCTWYNATSEPAVVPAEARLPEG